LASQTYESKTEAEAVFSSPAHGARKKAPPKPMGEIFQEGDEEEEEEEEEDNDV
jgi:hypothetical protein